MAVWPVLSCVTETVLGDRFMDSLAMSAETDSYLQPSVRHFKHCLLA